MRRCIRTVVILSVGTAMAMPGCVSMRSGSSESIRGTLERQARAWNAGDIAAFMEPYWQSEDLTFSSGGRVTRGWQATLDGYRRRYPNRAAMGTLTFTELEVHKLTADVALVLGRWHLERDEPVGGAFSLVVRREAGRWTIVHDHTSRDAS